MNRVIRVYKGAEIPTVEGVLKVTDTTAAGLIYCDHYNVTEAGDLIFDTERRLTKSELANEAWRVDGRVHDVNVINHYCDTCKHYIDEFFYNGSADCKKIDIMTEAEIDLYYTDAQPNCPHWEPMAPME